MKHHPIETDMRAAQGRPNQGVMSEETLMNNTLTRRLNLLHNCTRGLMPLLMLAMLLMGALSARAATLTVSSLADDGSAGTLRSQIAAAAAGDTIDFNVTGTITLDYSRNQLVISKNLTVQGPTTTPGITVTGSNGKRVLRVAAEVTLSDLTITGGYINLNAPPYPGYPDSAGGGIFNAGGTLTLNNCSVSSNYNGGIYNSGTLAVTGGIISNNNSVTGAPGYGILNNGGTVTVTSSTLSGNKGSAIANSNVGTVTVTGSTLSANNASSTSTSTSAISNGGGINNGSGTVTVMGCTLSGNSATTTITSVITKGGGIYNGGTLTVTDSTLSDNSAKSAAGIYNAATGTLTLKSSTLSANMASPNQGGGILNDGGVATVSNSTFFGNRSGSHGGGIFNGSGTVTVTGCTLSGNIGYNSGGGISSAGTLNLSNSIVAGNTSNFGSTTRDLSGTMTSGGYNLVQTGGTLTGTGNITGQSAGLDTLKTTNGGPTATMALLLSSPAINAGDPNFDTLTTPYDQRGAGFARKVSNAIDIGAFESLLANRSPVATNVSFTGYRDNAFSGGLAVSDADADDTLLYSIVTGTLPAGLTLNAATGIISGTPTGFSSSSLTFKATDNNGADSNTATATITVVEKPSLIVDINTDTTNNSDGLTSLREAVAYGNSGNAGANPEVTFANNVTGIIETTSPTISISNNLTITGPGASSLTISGNGNDGVSYNAASIFKITGGIIGISGLTLKDGTGTSISRQAFNPNTNSYYTTYDTFGGGIYMTGGTVTIADTTISNHFAQYGGGICVNGGSLELKSSTVSNNNLGAYGYAGGIYLQRGTMAIRNSTISGNRAGYGGGIISDGTLTISNSTISANIAQNYEELLGYQVGSPTADGRIPGIIYYDYFSFNGVAGGILNNGTLTLTNSTVSGNEAKGYQTTNIGGGGGINNRGTLTVANSTITGNKGQFGGGVHARSGTLNLSNSIVAGNISDTYTSHGATYGGGPDIFGTVNSGDYNLVQDIGGATLSGTHNITGQAANLGALANNGAPAQTHALLAGSPAVNKGNPSFDGTGKTDQRGAGFPRVVGGTVDIGAYESAFLNNPPQLNNATYTGVVGNSFSQQLAGSDADASDTLTYTLATGFTFPAGLTLSSTGLISGTPTTAGRTDFSVNVTDGSATSTAKFIIIISAVGVDGIGPIMTRGPLGSSYTRAGLAQLVYTGTVKDVAQDAVTPVGVKQVLFQLRQGATAYSGNETDGFTTNLNRGYFPAFVSATDDGTTAGLSTFRRTFSSFIPSNLPTGAYSLVILGQDNLNNFSVEVVPVNITVAAAGAALSPFGAVGSGGGS